MLTLLLWLTPFIAIAVIVWNYRRKVAAREAASGERLKEFLSKPAADGATSQAQPAAFSTPVPAATANSPPRSPTEYAVRARMLTPPQTVLYYLLKTSLPDHEVLAQVSIAAFIDVPAAISGFEREARERRLAGAVADFAVCDKSFKAVAVVQYSAREAGGATTLAFARECSESAGLRWVEMMPDVLPERDTVRSIVLGV